MQNYRPALPDLQNSVAKPGVPIVEDGLLDLSFARTLPTHRSALPTELAVLLGGVATRQAASPAGRLALMLDRPLPASTLFAPESGSFHAGTAAALTRWKGL